MRLCFIARDITDIGGIQQTTSLIANCLDDDGNNVTIISLYHKFENPSFLLHPSIKTIKLFDRFADTKKDFWSIKKQVKNILNIGNYDVIIVQGTAFANYLPRNIWEKGVIVCEHEHYHSGRLGGLHWFGIRKSLKFASAIVCLTELDANNFRKKTKNINIYAIGNSYAGEISNNYNRESKTIVSCGSLTSLKGFDKAILAAKSVLKDNQDWKWKIYGVGQEHKNLEQLIIESNLQDRVFLCGYESDKDAIYADKAIYVCTSKFEGFGMTILEAMKYGLPVISFNIKYGPMELVQDNKNGFLVPQDITSLSNALSLLIKNDNLRSNMSNYSLKVASNYSMEQIYKKWLIVLEDVTHVKHYK